MFNIILSSSGLNDINNYVSDDIKEFIKKISINKKVMILANAAPIGTGNYIARDNVKNNFINMGASLVDIIDLDNSNINIILNYDIIYCLGGDLKPLIELNKNTKLKEYIIKFLKKGIYIGESAGSMFLCDDLEWAYEIKRGTKKKYDIYLDSYKGLNITKHKVFPHYNKITDELKERINIYEKENSTKFDILNDGEYILDYYE